MTVLIAKLRRFIRAIVFRQCDESDKCVDRIDSSVEEHDVAYYDRMAERLRNNAARGMMPETVELLRFLPITKGQSILEIGIGTGEATKYFVESGLHVTATGLNIESYGLDAEEYKRMSVDIVDCTVEELPFQDSAFDACWMSHVLEHTMNPGIALQNVRRVLKDGGWLFVIVPPYKSKVVGGHVLTGWNIGQLMYLLLLNRFDVKNGHFVKHGYNICAFVRKSEIELPRLYSDIGDIEMLGNYWPQPFSHGFDGDIEAVNWPPVLDHV